MTYLLETQTRFLGDTTGTLGDGLTMYFPFSESEGDCRDIISGRVFAVQGTEPVIEHTAVGEGVFHVCPDDGGTYYSTKNVDGFWPSGHETFTFSAWFKAGSGFAGNWDCVIIDWQNGVTAKYKWGIQNRGTENRMHMTAATDASGTLVNAVSTVPVADGTTYLVVVQHDATADKIRISVNAETLVETAQSAGIQEVDLNQINLGLVNGQSVESALTIGTCAMWSRSLSQTEIAAYYNSGSGLKINRVI